MGLNAFVFCDCYETGRLLNPPPPGCLLKVDNNGSLECTSDDLEVLLAFDQWRQARACEHEDGVLFGHYLGNAGHIAALREKLSQTPIKYPMILHKILYSGIHGGDYISYPELFLLRPDVEALVVAHCDEPIMEAHIREFESQMVELLEAALRVRKPIAF